MERRRKKILIRVKKVTWLASKKNFSTKNANKINLTGRINLTRQG
jgi:hypothetical protein